LSSHGKFVGHIKGKDCPVMESL